LIQPPWTHPGFLRSLFANSDLSWKITPPTALALTESHLVCARIQDPSQPPVIGFIPLSAILSIQLSTILLFAWMKLSWVEPDALQQETIYFNAVSVKLFSQLAERLRAHGSQALSATPARARQSAGLSGLPYKFSNLIPHQLLPGEAILHVLFRPAIWAAAPVWRRQLTAPRLCLVLTSQHLIQVEEETDGRENNYAFIATFFPLAMVRQLRLLPQVPALEITLGTSSSQTQVKSQVTLHEQNIEASTQLIFHFTHLVTRLQKPAAGSP
jgi:hypothetical protein